MPATVFLDELMLMALACLNLFPGTQPTSQQPCHFCRSNRNACASELLKHMERFKLRGQVARSVQLRKKLSSFISIYRTLSGDSRGSSWLENIAASFAWCWLRVSCVL
jgi:hypothetical protein